MNARRQARWLLLGAAFLAAGCGDAGRKAERYRVEQLAYSAQRAEREARLGRTRPDSLTLLSLRNGYAKIRSVAKAPFLTGSSEKSKELGRDILQLVATGELQSARLAMEAGRPDLALEQSRWLEQHSEGDVMVARQADFLAIGVLRMTGKTDEAVERMRAMVRRYPPSPPPKGTSQEDPILALPEMMSQVRREQGDQAGAARELEFANAYYQGLLRSPRDPMLEALIRARLVRTAIEANQPAVGLEQVNALERLVAANPPLKSLEPELLFSKAKIRGMIDRDHSDAVAMLQSFARQYPKHVLAPQAIFEAAVYLEDAKKLPEALAGYREVVALYPGETQIAPVALFREAMLEERTGDWNQAKATLESVPVKYPRSPAAVEAPFTIAMRYYARGDKQAARGALARAVMTYKEMIARDSTSSLVPACRYNILRGQLSLGDWEKALGTVDDMALHNPKHPYTAQALLEGAKVANANGQKERALGYLEQFLENFPNSPVAGQVRQQKEKLLH